MSPVALKGRVMLITGAGSGIGRALAIQAAGAEVVLTGRRSDMLEQTAALMMPGPSIVFPADITSTDGRCGLEEVVRRRYGRLDILVNNAGMGSVGPIDAPPDDAIERMVATNLTAPIQLVRLFLPLLRAAAPSARVVNIGSMFGDIAYPLFAAYSASKFGLRGYSDAIRRELSGSGIGVTHVAPRATRTPAMTDFEALIKPFGMQVDSADKVAHHILDGTLAGRRRIYPRGPERLFVLIQALWPSLIDRVIHRQMSAVRRQHGFETVGSPAPDSAASRPPESSTRQPDPLAEPSSF